MLNVVIFFRIAEILEGVLERDFKDNKIMIIAATESLDLNEKLFSCRGKHYFKNVYSITDLNKVGVLIGICFLLLIIRFRI